ncbi:PilW family protein [Chromobacterium sp. IIBBL 290-4]|uniref:PilW family protein n=1 Tax=Chromobacterium sp. IIBBL 290-4 TaxID=2953890 RepID=UPI0020B7BA0F|nr:PilW family protein [Chromobacterium sp. IIBBL 290-4]UTH74331.1 PilW family protein [Chromobacterium sp. IIBBL 290-4]
MNGRCRRQCGSGLIEVMVSVTIGLFLLSVLLMIFASTEMAETDESGLAQLQDNQRSAMTIINTIAQSAGYYPAPQTQTLAAALPASGAFAAGQSIAGTVGPPDTLSIRFQTAPNDGVLNCNGSGNSGSGNTIYINQFAISNGQLTCAVNGGSAQVLVDGVSNMSVLYGVDENGGGSVTHYYNASSIPAGDTVRSLKVTLTMANPLSRQAGQPASVTMSWLIGLMNQL